MTDKIMEQIQEIRERHVMGAGGPLCGCRDCQGERCSCGVLLPCDAIQLAQKLELAVKALEKAALHLRLAAGVIQRAPSRYATHEHADLAVNALSAIADLGNE